MLHPPGGLVGLDTLEARLHVHPGAGALVTSPGAAKIYRNDRRPSRVAQHLRVQAGGLLEWLPQETLDDFKKYLNEYSVPRADLNEIMRLGEKKGIEADVASFNADYNFFRTIVKSEIARLIWGEDESAMIRTQLDNMIEEALTYFSEADEFSENYR